MDRGLRARASCRGFATQYPRRTFRMARVGVNALMLLAPMFDDAAAPETAMAVARSSSWTSSSNSVVRTYLVAPQEISLNVKRSSGANSKFSYFINSSVTATSSGLDMGAREYDPGGRPSMVVGSNRNALLNRS